MISLTNIDIVSRRRTRASTSKRVQPNKSIPLPRPRRGVDVDLSSAFPELQHISPQFLRDSLAPMGISMRKSLANIRVVSPQIDSLPSQISIEMTNNVAVAPSHMLAVYAPGQTTCQVTLHPTHQIVLAAHCSRLPQLPAAALSPAPSSSSLFDSSLPVVPLCLPSPSTFSALQTYLYTKRLDVLMCFIKQRSSRGTVVSRILGLHLNALALGVVDGPLYDALEEAMKLASNPC